MGNLEVLANIIFEICVAILIQLAAMTGFTYREINVIIFCIMMPILFVVMAYIIYRQHRKITQLSKNI